MRNPDSSAQRCCENILAYDKQVHGFVEGTVDVDEILACDAIQQKRFEDVSPRPPAMGMLLGVKDIINADGYETRCGSTLPANLLGRKEASVVTRLRNAGAIVAGKTVTTEFAISDPGPTCNPRNLKHTPGGSSSGSAAGVAAGFFDIALGTQTAGSVIRPAAYCGVIGFKPSFGRIPRDGVFPYSPSMDHVGLFAKNFSCLNTAIKVACPKWREVNTPDNQKMTMCIPEGPYLDITVQSALDHYLGVVASIKAYDFTIKATPILENIHELNHALDELTYAEACRVHQPWFEKYKAHYKPTSLAGMKIGKAVSDDDLIKLLDQAKIHQSKMQQQMIDLDIEFIIAPAAPDVAPEGLGSTGDYRMNSIWSYTGLPVITIPTGVNHQNLPYGLQIVGQFGCDEKLINVAQRLQQAINIEPINNNW